MTNEIAYGLGGGASVECAAGQSQGTREKKGHVELKKRGTPGTADLSRVEITWHSTQKTVKVTGICPGYVVCQLAQHTTTWHSKEIRGQKSMQF